MGGSSSAAPLCLLYCTSLPYLRAPNLLLTDWATPLDGPSWTPDDSVTLCRRLKELGVDLIDVSSGGQLPRPVLTVGPGYQVCVCRLCAAPYGEGWGGWGGWGEPGWCVLRRPVAAASADRGARIPDGWSTGMARRGDT